MIALLVVSFSEACSCFAGVVALLALIVAFWQLSKQVKAIKTNNSIEVLSWFDDPLITDLLWDIDKENKVLEDAIPENVEQTIEKLLNNLDTICTLKKQKGFDPSYFVQMNVDFKNMARNNRVQAVYNKNKDIYPDLDFQMLIDMSEQKS